MEKNNNAIDMILKGLNDDESNDVNFDNDTMATNPIELNSTIENMEKFIKEKYNEIAISHLKNNILEDVRKEIKESGKCTYQDKECLTTLLKQHIDFLISEVHFLREELREKNSFIKSLMVNIDRNEYLKNVHASNFSNPKIDVIQNANNFPEKVDIMQQAKVHHITANNPFNPFSEMPDNTSQPVNNKLNFQNVTIRSRSYQSKNLTSPEQQHLSSGISLIPPPLSPSSTEANDHITQLTEISSSEQTNNQHSDNLAPIILASSKEEEKQIHL